MVDVFSTGMQDGLVIAEFLVGCLLLGVSMSCRALGNDGLVINFFVFLPFCSSFAELFLRSWYENDEDKVYS